MENNWVADQMSLLDPPASWRIDPDAALERFHCGTGTPARRAGNRAGAWRLALWAAAVLCTAVAAQQFWQYLTVGPRVAFIHVDPWPEGVPAPRIKPLAPPLPPIPAAD